jgi:hypothetical protein
VAGTRTRRLTRSFAGCRSVPVRRRWCHAPRTLGRGLLEPSLPELFEQIGLVEQAGHWQLSVVRHGGKSKVERTLQRVVDAQFESHVSLWRRRPSQLILTGSIYLPCICVDRVHEFAPQTPRFDCAGVIWPYTTLRNGLPGIKKIGPRVQLK